MTDLRTHLHDYLKMRRALGFKLEVPGYFLAQLVDFIEDAGATTLTAELAISWARLPQGVQPIHWARRLGAARGFAEYLQTIDPATEVPPRDVFGARQQRPTPHLWCEADIVSLMKAARQLQPAMRAASTEALFGLLAVSGMRIGEALDLERKDVNLTSGVITIREAKFRRDRIVPLHESATQALRSYADRRDRMCLNPRDQTFFVTCAGTALGRQSVRYAFNSITTELGLRSTTSRPRIHDLRHTFAVRTLIGWLASGSDVGVGMPVLSTYLGHVSPVGTYWYLSASPELMELAAARLDCHFGGRS
jgi:integrase/recombinase XerD